MYFILKIDRGYRIMNGVTLVTHSFWKAYNDAQVVLTDLNRS